MPTNTPELDLLKMDPATDGQQNFNIKTMLSDNLDKIDARAKVEREHRQNTENPHSTTAAQVGAYTKSEADDMAATKATAAQTAATNFTKAAGLGDVAKDISSTDLNVLDVTGFYRGHTLTNGPVAASSGAYFYIIHTKHSATHKSQIAIRFASGSDAGMISHRLQTAGTWTAWAPLETAAGAAAKASAATTAANSYTDTHAADTNNPHSTTAAQVGAYTKTEANNAFAPKAHVGKGGTEHPLAVAGAPGTPGFMSGEQADKLAKIAALAEVNQNAFSNIKVGTATAAADQKTDTFELIAGTNIVLTLDVANDKLTIATPDTIYKQRGTTYVTAVDWDTLTDVGIYAIGPTSFDTAGGAANFPANQTYQYGLLEVVALGAGILQRFTPRNKDYSAWERTKATTWGAWVEKVHVVAEGSNANGEYVRYSNGIQECWKQEYFATTTASTWVGVNVAGRYYYYYPGSWTFPAAFKSGTKVVKFAGGDISGASVEHHSAFHTDDATQHTACSLESGIEAYNPIVNGVGISIRRSLYAKGYWK